MHMKFLLKYILLLIGGIFFVARGIDKKPKPFSWKRVILLLILVGGIILAVSSFGVWYSHNDRFQAKIDGCAVIFGAAVWKGDVPSHALYDRTMAGIDLYKNEQVDCLVLSGGNSTYGAHEVDVIAKIATENRIPDRVTYLDYEGENTLATLQNLPETETAFVLVSNDFHLGRINLLARRLGVPNFDLHSAEYRQGRYVKERYFFAREIAAMLFYAVMPLELL